MPAQESHFTDRVSGIYIFQLSVLQSSRGKKKNKRGTIIRKKKGGETKEGQLKKKKEKN